MPKTPFTVAFLVIPGFSMVALSSVVEPLRAANQLTGKHLYEWDLIGLEDGLVAAANRLEIRVHHSIANAPESDLTIVVASQGISTFSDRECLRWVRQRRGQIGAISSGALILARAGLLENRRATVHWDMQRQLAEEFETVDVVPDLYCVDGNVMTAAGGIAAMDLMLDLITQRQGREVAVDVSENFLHGRIRASREMQRQDVAWRYQTTDRRVVYAIGMMENAIRQPVAIQAIAKVLGISERQFERLFKAHVGQKPSEFYINLRLKSAYELLRQSTFSLDEIGEKCGFSSASHFSRAFKRRYDETPRTVRIAKKEQ